MEKTVHTQTEMFERTVFLMKSLRKPLFSKKKTYLSVLEKSLLLGLLLSFLLTMTGFSGQCEAIENQVFRFHVLANSDSQEDQALKLKVRDRGIISECSDPGRGRSLSRRPFTGAVSGRSG